MQPTDTFPVTEAYQEPPPNGRGESVRVALVAGSSRTPAGDLYDLLLRRLRALVLIGFAWMVIGFGLYQSVQFVEARFDPTLEIFRDVPQWAPIYAGIDLCINVVLTALVWLRPPRSLGGLRAIELALLGLLVVGTLLVTGSFYQRYLIPAPASPPHLRVLQVNVFSLYQSGWFMILAAYGVFIPNTWKRCVLVCGVVGACPLVLFAVLAYWVMPTDPALATLVLARMAAVVGIGLAVVLFGVYRVEVLRRERDSARRYGQYVLAHRLGSGGMGEVYQAEHVLLRRPCAIKLIRPERAGDPGTLKRFEREVQVTATLTHPNTVQIFDYGHADDGTFYYVMEYLPGLTLEQLVKRHGSLPPARAVHFLRQVCAALREAHAVGLIHRDVKPGNVMACERGGRHDVAKLLDFGLVRDQGGTGTTMLTQEGAVAGTPAYLSPEQAAGGEAVDARSDVYSLGALAYFLLTGRPPFADGSAVKMMAAHLYEAPAPPSTHRPDVPADLDAVVLRCLAKAPADRFPDVRALERALTECPCAGIWTDDDAASWWRDRTAMADGKAPFLEASR